MGQQTFGILYGIAIPENLHIQQDYGDEEGPGLLDKWEDTCRDEIEALRNSNQLERFEQPQTRFIPDVEGDSNLMGFWLAAGGSGKPGSPYLGVPAPLNALEATEPYAEFYPAIKARWERFALWAKESEGIELPEVTLWLTETEVA